MSFLDEMLKTARAAEARKPDKDLLYMLRQFPGAQLREMRIAGLEADRLQREAAREVAKEGIKMPRAKMGGHDHSSAAPGHLPGANAGLTGKSGTPEPTEVWADRDRAPAPLAKPRGFLTSPGHFAGMAAVIRGG